MRGERPWIPGKPGASGNLLHFKEKKKVPKKKPRKKIKSMILTWKMVTSHKFHLAPQTLVSVSTPSLQLSSLDFKDILKKPRVNQAGVSKQHPAFAVLKTRKSRWARTAISSLWSLGQRVCTRACRAAAWHHTGDALCPPESLHQRHTKQTPSLLPKAAAALSPYYSALPFSETLIPCSNIP